VICELKHPFGDGTTHILFTPEDFVARLGGPGTETQGQSDSLLSQDLGVFAPNSPFSRGVVPGSAKPERKKPNKTTIATSAETSVDQALPSAPLTWAERLNRVFDIDLSVCPLCGGTLRMIADVTDPGVIQTILAHLKQRAPPGAAHLQTPLQAAPDDLFAVS